MVEVQEAWEEICRKMGPCWDFFSQKVDVPFHDVPFIKKMLILVFFICLSRTYEYILLTKFVV